MVRLAAQLVVLLSASAAVAASGIVSPAGRLSADIAADGRIATDLGGDLWLVPDGGGPATRLAAGIGTASRPRWSPDATRIAFQAISGGIARLFVYDLGGGVYRPVGRDGAADLHPAWHPQGRRLAYASDRSGSGLDLWEVDLPTGLHWRLSSRAGDETEPAWSADGRDLAYVHRLGNRWSLILRRFGQPEATLLSTTERISAPSWRPDGSLILYIRDAADGRRLDMAILSDPPLLRTYLDGEALHASPVAWQNRERMIYAAGGRIRQRSFDDWSSRPLPVEAVLEEPREAPAAIPRRNLPVVDEPSGRLVVRADRLFDGVADDYRNDVDIVIDRGRIAAIEPRSERPGDIVIDLDDVTVLPGLVDADAVLPAGPPVRVGAAVLAAGVTTIVADAGDSTALNTTWSGKASPGPRVLHRGEWPVRVSAAMADAMTPGLDELLGSRAARAFGSVPPPPRRFAEPPGRLEDTTSLVLGSHDNGLPAGIGLHAELRARAAAGLEPAQALRAAGVNAAAALGVDPYLGRVAVGAAADLVLVDGDPLADIGAALDVVAVVRNGRFFSVASLLDRAAAAATVE